MDDYAVGDTVGWRFSCLNGRDLDTEMRGEVVAIHGNHLCIRSFHITCPTMDPFHSRAKSACHLVMKANTPLSIAAE